jgi:membrane associated rhomboid family serine protease
VAEYGIIALTTLVFLYEQTLDRAALETLFRAYGVVPARLLGTVPPWHPVAEGPRFAGLVASMFLHAGWFHFLGNMWFLYIFGDNVEDHLGHGRFLTFYLLCGIGAALVQAFVQPNSQVPMVGASGAIAGVMGAYFVLYPRARIVTVLPIFLFFTFVELPAVFFLGIWFLIQFVSGTAAAVAGVQGGVAFWAHAGGFVVGILLLGALGGWRRPSPPAVQWRRPFHGGWY